MFDAADVTSRAVGMLRAAGLTVSVRDDSTLALSKDGIITEVEMRSRRSATYEWDARRLLDTTTRKVLVVVPRASRSLVTVAKGNPRLSVASLEDHRLLWQGAEIETVRAPSQTPRVASRRSPWGRWALMRVLALTDTPRSQVALSRDTDISQPGVSQSLASLGDLVVRERDGWRAADRSALWDEFLADCAGPGGISTYWYGLDAITVQMEKAIKVASETGVDALRSGDAAADELAPWRKPRSAVLYARTGLLLNKRGFAESAPDKATLEVVVPADRTVWATAGAQGVAGVVDPLVAAWDVLRTGGPDAPDAAARLKSVALARTESHSTV